MADFAAAINACFNEAAANRCGAHKPEYAAQKLNLGFNEAAANRCGAQVTTSEGHVVTFGASMRPQRIAAEHPVCPTALRRTENTLQ